MMALGLAGFGTVAWIATRTHTEIHHRAAAPQKIAILVAGRPLQAGALLKPGDLSSALVLAQAVPSGANRDTPAVRAGLVGAMIRRPLVVGEAILEPDVMRPGDHGFLAAVLAPGMRAVTVGVDAISGSAGLIWPGDRVDLVLTQEIADRNLPLGERLAAETVLTDVRVIAIDQHLVEGANPNGLASDLARTVSLEVTPREAEDVAVAAGLGRLSLVVRSADTAKRGTARPVDAPGIAWASQVSPALNVAAPKAVGGATMRVFRGSENAQEVHF
ncbi:MAG TPA: Flp pilus assembly protein CpaB [Acetobacteraceae bacterium]|nr:Flp pilus assembly protein CpaB [Acetobacteraceae bacterium]